MTLVSADELSSECGRSEDVGTPGQVGRWVDADGPGPTDHEDSAVCQGPGHTLLRGLELHRQVQRVEEISRVKKMSAEGILFGDWVKIILDCSRTLNNPEHLDTVLYENLPYSLFCF